MQAQALRAGCSQAAYRLQAENSSLPAKAGTTNIGYEKSTTSAASFASCFTLPTSASASINVHLRLFNPFAIKPAAMAQ